MAHPSSGSVLDEELAPQDLLKLSTVDYSIGERIHTGKYSCVYSAQRVSFHGTLVRLVVKVINKMNADPIVLERLLSGLKLWCELRNDNLVPIEQIYAFGPEKLYVFMNYMHRGSVSDHLERCGPVGESVVRYWFRDVFDGVKYLHDKAVAIRNLRLDNIYLDRNFRCRIGNLSMCFECTSKYAGNIPVDSNAEKSMYSPPESLQGHPYDPVAGDLWSLGACLFTVVSGKAPFDIFSMARLFEPQEQDILFHAGIRGNLTEEFKNVVRGLLRPVSSRWTIQQVVGSSWLTNI